MYFIILIGLFFACIGNKTVLQDTTIPSTTKEKVLDTIIKIESKKPNPKTVLIHKKETLTPKKKPKTNVEFFNHQSWDNLLQKHVSDQGTVNYNGLKKDFKILKTYLISLTKNTPKEDWPKSDQLAYWMNAYNAFTIKLIIDNYPIKSIKEIKDPWDFRFIKLEKKWYTLNDIEHRILRKMKDPRIHFGINCASLSCPKLLNKAFTSHNVNQELEKLTSDFINDPRQNLITKNTIQLSKLFTWFAKDFKTKGSLISFLNQYSKITIDETAKKSFKKYDWRLNE